MTFSILARTSPYSPLAGLVELASRLALTIASAGTRPAFRAEVDIHWCVMNDDDNDDRLQEAAPLADKLRPKTVEQVVGQDHVTTGPDALFGLDSDAPVTTENIIFWGPPG
jgi:hypothetical protein